MNAPEEPSILLLSRGGKNEVDAKNFVFEKLKSGCRKTCGDLLPSSSSTGGRRWSGPGGGNEAREKWIDRSCVSKVEAMRLGKRFKREGNRKERIKDAT